MRDLTGGVDQATVEGRNLRQVVAALEVLYPGISARLRDDDRVASGLAVSIDGVVTSRGMLAQVRPESEIHIHPALGGG